MKYNDIKPFINSGKIVDEGCADCALISFLTRDYPDSDIIGVEIAGEFIARCRERQRVGEFGGAFVHIRQRNLMSRLFEEASIDTAICNSTTHELWSYLDQEKSIRKYLDMKHDQLREGGRLIIRDVVGPDSKEGEVYVWLNSQDGENDDPFRELSDKKELAQYLSGLSTQARFKRFANDFLEDARREGKRSENSRIKFEEVEMEGEAYFKMRLKDAVEFMSKKDYTDNWASELNEEFAFWSFEEWKDALRRANFYVVENSNNPELSSRAYTNQWIKENRYEGHVGLYQKEGANLRQMDYPVTNMLLVGEKVQT